MNTLVKPRQHFYVNRFPLGMSNKTDWKGLEQYIKYMFGENDSDRSYALREVGNIFPKWIPIGPSLDKIPPYIPRIKNMVAVQYRGYHAWHPYGIMTEQERMAVLKRWTGDTWVTENGDTSFKYYDSTWKNVKWSKYYDGADWQTFWSLIPDDFTALFTSDPIGWTDLITLDAASGACWFRMGSTVGVTSGANSHSHASVSMSLSNPSLTSGGGSVGIYSFGGGLHTHSATHAANSVNYNTASSLYRAFVSKLNGQISIPSGTICFWSGTTANIPTGWSYVSANNGYYLRQRSVGTGQNSSATDSNRHDVTGNSGTSGTGASTRTGLGPGSTHAAENISHAHALSSTSHLAAHAHTSIVPSYFNVILMSADNETGELPLNGVTLFYNAPGSIIGLTWTRVSAADNNMLMPDSSYGGTGGASTHTHTHASAFSANWAATSTVVDWSGSTNYHLNTSHSHPFAAGTHPSSTDNSMPTCYSMLLYERTT